MRKQFFHYTIQSIAGMIGISVYILADTFFISVHSGADGLAVLNLILPVYGLVYAIGAMIGIGSATRYSIDKAQQKNTSFYFTQSICWTLLCSVPFILTGIFLPDSWQMCLPTRNRLYILERGGNADDDLYHRKHHNLPCPDGKLP